MMTVNTIYLYSDASFSKEKLRGVSGYLIFKNAEQHEAGVTPLSLIRTESFHELTNTRAELKGILLAMDALKQITQEKINIKIYTDCQAVTHLLSRRKKLESSGFISRRKNQILPNADIYKMFFLLYDQLRPEILWVKGHSPNRDDDLIRKNFSFIDKLVRKELRAI